MRSSSQENLSQTDFPPPKNPAHFSDSFFDGQEAAAATIAAAGKKYLVFYLADEIFAVSARRVSEIIHLPPVVAPLPNVPEWLLGVVNLRGEIISVADLAKLWKKKNSPLSAKTKLIVLRGETSSASIAFPADKLGEIVALTDNEIKLNLEAATEIFGQAAYKSGVLNLLDAEKLISSLKIA